ncbi:endonuclease III [Candidatus Bathyarchaeota archaeon]|nr:endonuclease III [Candidatus Bathyarchaeota archaeon]
MDILRKEFPRPKWITPIKDPFETLIITIISQNTNDRNTARAFEKLSNAFQIAPQALANAETTEIEECLKVAGLYRNKAKVIKEVSRIILEDLGGSLEKILNMPLDEARRALMQLPGVGAKTADVVLLFAAKKPTIPVDTHVNRVSKRLGLAPVDGDYEKVRKALQRLYPPEDYLDAHIFLILLGRKFCRARNPLCRQCPVSSLCPSRKV